MQRIDMIPQISCERVSWQTITGPAIALVVTAACLFFPNEAFAQAAHYQIEFSVAKNLPKCDRALDFEGMLGNLLAKPLLVPPASRVLAVRIAKTKTGDFAVDLAGKESDGRAVWSLHHEFSAETSCFEVLHKAALRSAIAMEHQASLEEPPPPPPETSPQCPAPAPALQCSTPDSPKSVPIERNWFVGAGGMVGFGIAPEILAGVQFIGGWKWSRSWSIEVSARATLPDDSRPLGPTVVRVHTLGLLSAAPCYRVGRFGACGLIVGGAMFFESISVGQPRVGVAPFVGLGPRGFLEHRLSERWSARFDADLVVPLLWPEIQDDASEERWRPKPITGTASVSMIAWF